MASLVRLAIFLFVFILIFSGCDKSTPQPSANVSQRTQIVSSPPRLHENIHLVEDHSQSLAIWARADIRNATILHVDAHHDLLPVPSPKNLEKVQMLLQEGRFDDLEAAGGYFAPRDKALYGITNYLNLAYKVGIAKRIYWAYPYQGTPTPEKLEAFREYLVQSVVPKQRAEMRALAISPPFLTGTLGGVPLTIGSLSDFQPDDSSVLLDIDLSFFPGLYRNPVSTPYLNILGGFTRFLKERGIEPKQTVISYSNNGENLPIEYRYIGTWLKNLLTEPSLLDQEPSVLWRVKTEATHREFFKQFDSAAELYQGLIREYPNEPDAYFSLAMNLIAQGQEEQGLANIEKARKIDPLYIHGYITVAEFYNQQKEPELAIKVLEKAERLAPGEIFLLDALGNMHHNLENYREAAAYYRKILATDRSTPTTHVYLADSLFFLGQYSEALNYYQQAIISAQDAPDTYLDPGVWLQLAQTRIKLGRKDEAMATLIQFFQEQPDAPEEIRAEANKLLANLRSQR